MRVGSATVSGSRRSIQGGGTEPLPTSVPELAETVDVNVAQAMKHANDSEIARSPKQHPKEQPDQKHAGKHGQCASRRAARKVVEMQWTEREDQVADQNAEQ